MRMIDPNSVDFAHHPCQSTTVNALSTIYNSFVTTDNDNTGSLTMMTTTFLPKSTFHILKLVSETLVSNHNLLVRPMSQGLPPRRSEDRLQDYSQMRTSTLIITKVI